MLSRDEVEQNRVRRCALVNQFTLSWVGVAGMHEFSMGELFTADSSYTSSLLLIHHSRRLLFNRDVGCSIKGENGGRC